MTTRTHLKQWQVDWDLYTVKGRVFNSKMFADGAFVNLVFEEINSQHHFSVVHTTNEHYYLFSEDENKNDLG